MKKTIYFYYFFSSMGLFKSVLSPVNLNDSEYIPPPDDVDISTEEELEELKQQYEKWEKATMKLGLVFLEGQFGYNWFFDSNMLKDEFDLYLAQRITYALFEKLSITDEFEIVQGKIDNKETRDFIYESRNHSLVINNVQKLQLFYEGNTIDNLESDEREKLILTWK